MRGRGLLVVLVGAVAVAAVGTGCGSSGASGDSSQVVATNISKRAFLKKAEVVCQKNYDEVRAGYEAFTKEHGGSENAFDDTESNIEYANTVMIPEKKKTVEELKELGAPAGDEKQVEGIIDAYEEGIEVGEENPEAVMSSQGVFAYATSVAKEYGLKSCYY